jgi:alkylation response protein AidB-like acyl-CoA dehydrogenase
MDIAFTEEQEMLRKAAQDFLTAECPKKKVRELEEDSKGHSPEIWKKMADLGWQGMVIPEKYSGQGMTFQDFTILIEEMGRNILPGPFACTVVEGILPIIDAGTEEQKNEFLPRIASGELILTMAQLEPNGLFDASGITVKAAAKGDHYVIDGTKVFVEMANVANYMLCVTRTSKGTSPADGVTVFIVDAKSPGVHIEVMPTIGMEKLCEVQFKDVSVPKKNILGKLDKGWGIVETVMRRGAIAKCAESIGGMQAAVEMTVAYSKERVQYDRPIGAFQALQHIMADMWTAMQTSRYIVYQAAWLESEGLPSEKEVAMAKAYVNEKYKWLTEKGVLLHGAIGTSREHDIPLYFRRAKAADIRYGGTDYWREVVATKIGLVS